MNKKKPATPKDDQPQQVNYSLYRFIFKPALILVLAAAYVPIYLALILSLPLLPTRLSNRLINWLAAEQGGM